MIQVTSKVVLDQVYHNGLHSLTRLEIKNISEYPLKLNNQIAFQKTNENLPDIDAMEFSSTTNTVEAAMNFKGQVPFNQIFNFVNHIDQIELDPQQTQRIIIAFLPEEKEESNYIDKNDKTFDFFEVNGLFFFVCFKVGDHVDEVIPRTPVRSDSKLGSESGQIPPDYQTTTKFRSRVCKSVLTTDISSTGLIFDDCVAGGTYFKDFTVHNRSEIDLFWILNTVDLSNKGDKAWLKFTDYETGEALDFMPIPSYSPKRIRITFKPLEVGEFNYDLQIENQNDSSNTVQTHIHAVVRSVQRDDRLVVSSGPNLDFGDCCAGVMKRKQLVLKNVGDAPLEVSFVSDNSGEISFALRNEERPTGIARPFKPYLRMTSRTVSEDSFRDLDLSSQGDIPDRLVHERLMNELHGMNPRSFSDVSISRTRSSSSSIESISGHFDHESLDLSELVAKSDSSLIRPYLDENVGASDLISGDDVSRIEELTIRPGTEKTIDVCYLPFREVITPDFRTSKLAKRNFKLFLSYFSSGKPNSKEKTTVQCVSRVCTSAIEVTPSEIHFGDTDVGTLKSASIDIKNCSDLPAIVELRFVSKVLSSIKGELIIQAKQTLEIKLDIYPRKVNPDYRKEITVANLLNPDNDQTVQVFSTNIDKQKVTIHSLFYHVLTPQATHFVDFGTSVLNSVVVRSITLENVSSKDLVLELTTSISSDLMLYIKADQLIGFMATTRVSGRREQLLQSIESRRRKREPFKPGKQTSGSSTNLPSSLSQSWLDEPEVENNEDNSPAYLDLASSGKPAEPRSPGRRSQTYSTQIRTLREHISRHGTVGDDSRPVIERKSTFINTEPFDSSKDVEFSKMSLDELLALAEKETGMPTPHFSKENLETKYVKLHQSIRKELDDQIRDQGLIPISTISLAPKTTQTVYLFLNVSGDSHSYIQGKSKKLDSSIFFKMVDFDRDLQHPQLDQLKQDPNWELPVRELMVRSFICRSIMELGQKHINFGNLDKSERRTKRIVIRNKSEVPLLYAIKKSGSIASGDLIFSDDQVGVIRGYGRREVEFVFNPSLPGLFQEKLTIQNTQNLENDQTLIVKSNIKQPANFHIKRQLLSFGPCLVDQFSPIFETISISNPSLRSSRVIEVRVDPQELRFEQCGFEIRFSIDTNEDSAQVTETVLSKETEEKIEQLEQKLKIATRKGREDKVQKILEQLDMLRSGKKMNDYGRGDEATLPSTESKTPTNPNSKVPSSKDLLEKPKVKATQSSIIFLIPPRGIKVVKVHLKPIRMNRLEKKAENEADYSITSQIAASDVESDYSPRSSTNLSQSLLLNEICTARIYVHEQKNTDIVKKILVKANVCYDPNTFTRALEEEKHNMLEERPSETNIESSPTFASPEATSPNITLGLEQFVGLSLELPIIDLGRVELGEPKDCYFTLINILECDASFYVNVPAEYSSLVSNLIKYGTVKSKESCKVDLAVKPKKVGYGVVKIHIKSARILDGSLTVSFVYYCVLPSYLQFSLGSTANANLILSDAKQGMYDLDFGYCYIDSSKKFAKVIGLQLCNTTKSTVFISAQSNLALQCFVFVDEGLEASLSTAVLKLDPLEKKLVFVALQPGLVSGTTQRKEKSSGTSVPNSANIDCRSLIGGIRVSVFVKDAEPSISKLSTKAPVLNDGLVHAYTHTIKFNATIGPSFFNVSTKNFDFGTITKVGSTLQGFITASNLSSRMPLDLLIEGTSPNISLEKHRYHLSALPETANVTELASEKILFSLSCPVVGYYSESFSIRNVNNSSQVITISINAFVDPQLVDVGIIAGKTPNFNSKELKWDNIYVTWSLIENIRSYAIQQKLNSDSIPSYECSFEVVNRSDELLRLIPTCNMDASLRWIVNTSSGFSVDSTEPSQKESKFQVCGSVLLLHPKEKAIGAVSIPKCGSKLNEMHEDLILGKKINLEGVLILQNASTHIAYKTLHLGAWYCMSFGAVEPILFDFGKVGHFSKWQDVKFEFTVQSSSEIPLQYDLEYPDFVSLNKIVDSNTGHEVVKRSVEPGTSHIVEMIFKPRKLPDGLERSDSFLVKYLNLYNPQNFTSISCRYQLTQFELKFERLVGGELVLPPLTHPSTGNSLSCDNWFTITNISDHDVKFDLGCTLSPDVSDIVLLEILSRQTSAPITGSLNLNPKSTVELKIKAVALETSRLKDPNLLKPEGVTFGTFWLSPKLASGTEETNKVTETFPIRGALVEGKTFSLLDKQLVFETVEESDSEDESAGSKVIQAAIQEKSLSIRNLSTCFPIVVKVSLEYPIEFSVGADQLFEITPLDHDSCIRIEPSSTSTLKLLLRQSPLYGESEHFRVTFVDTGSVTQKAQSVSIKFVDEANIPKIVSSPTKDNILLFDSPTKLDGIDAAGAVSRSNEDITKSLQAEVDAKPTLELKGCKKAICSVTGEFQGLYVLELGQQDLSSTVLSKKLVLEMLSGNRTSYKLSTINSFDQTFLTLSRTEGSLDQSSPNSTILLNFNLSNPGTWATYLIIENIGNPLDTKYIRIMMEVVAKQNVKRVALVGDTTAVTKVTYNHGNRIFDVYTNALNPQNLQLDVGTVSFGVVYSDRSFVVHNWENVPLDFTISTSLARDDPSEVMFSISRTGAKLFDTLRIEAESQKQVYLQFILEPHGESSTTKSFDIYINCRLIKDYQKVITFKAECQLPKLLVSETEFTFSNGNTEDDIPKCRTKDECIITNNTNEPLEYQIISESIYFSMEHLSAKSRKSTFPSMTTHFLQFLSKASGLDPSLYETEQFKMPYWSSTKSFTLQPKKSDKIRLIPNQETISRDKELLKKTKYVLEHFVIYNKQNPQERHRLNVNLNLGRLKEFQYASVSPNQFAFLESQCFLILSTIASNWEEDSLHDVYFLYRYVIDELCFFGTKEQAAQHHMNLATLLFRMIFSFRQSSLKFHPRWTRPFLNFLGYFPKRTTRNSPLQELATIALSDLF